MPPDSDALASPQPSLNQVLKALKRRELGLHNCVCSIAADAAFVREVAALWPGLPVCSNLRCGLWYAPAPELTAYFKSTDGHYGNWHFSATRLNLHVARAAAARGGCLLVDATRRGKAFPDALTKTVPIWAAVLNCAVQRVRAEAAQEAAPSGESGTAETGCGQAWDTEVHLPPWISANERAGIEAQLDAWVASFLQTARPAAEELAAALAKPLRPLWLSQQSRVWLNEVPPAEALGFTPLLLVSASQPNARHRQSLPGGRAGFQYVPGAGDDEESWARGLTPALFWAHQREVLAAGPEGVEAVVVGLLADACAGAAAHTSDTGSQAPSAAPAGVIRDEHHPAVRGCAPASQQDPRALEAPCPVGSTGVLLGAFAAGAPPAVWDTVDAVLNVGLTEQPGMANTAGAGRYRWLPIKSSKFARHALEDSLADALAFASSHLAAGRSVLIHCQEGVDQCVCVLLALLLCCYACETSSQEWAFARPFQPGLLARSGTGASPAGAEASTSEPVPVRNDRYKSARGEAAADGAGKHLMRQALAFISARYPAACPSRGNLKQAYNFARLYAAAVARTPDSACEPPVT